MPDATRVTTDEDINHDQPSLPSGHTVLQVIQLLEGGSTPAEAAERLDVPPADIVAAAAYHRHHPDEIEQIRKEKRLVADAHRLRHF